MPVGTPQLIAPACFTLSKVGPAAAGTAKPSATAKPAAIAAVAHVLGIPCPLLICCAGHAKRVCRLIIATLAQPRRDQQRAVLQASGRVQATARISAMYRSTARLR